MANNFGSCPIAVQENGEDRTRELDRLWRGRRTFAYIASKSGVDPDWLADTLDSMPEEYREDHFCLLASETSGSPNKIVVGAKHRAEALTSVLNDLQASEPVLESVSLLPLTCGQGFVNHWLWARTQERSLVPTPGLSAPAELAETLATARQAMLHLVAAQLPLLLVSYGGLSFPGVMRVHFAGGRLPQEKGAQLRRMFPNAAIFNNYCRAEAMHVLSIRRLQESDDARDVGVAIPGVELWAADNGSLMFRSPYRAVARAVSGHWQRISDHEWIPTGDIAEEQDNGRWKIVGRSPVNEPQERIVFPKMTGATAPPWARLVGRLQDLDEATI